MRETERRFRPEIQGLRALACVLVVVYHVWLGRISGGVDAFFLISGFLVTGQLYRAASRGKIEYRPMWGRMIKRLFPAALTVLMLVVAVSMVLLPQNRWFQTIKEVVASALYLENWQLAADSADYFAQHNSASVVQHFWSLSIQGQFYVVWPLLVGLVLLIAKRAKRNVGQMLTGVLGVVFAASLAYSVWLTAADQPLAYFDSLTRVWEFALGGLLALLIDRVQVPRPARIVFGWAGVAGLVSCGLVLQVGTVFPGYLALWPTLSAALVILAGDTAFKAGADRFLSSRPLKYLGDLSYALYLWHWPVLVFYLVARDREEVGLRGGAVIIALAFVLAVLTHHLVEKPVRVSAIGAGNRWGAYRFGAATLAAVLAATGAWQWVSVSQAENYSIAVDDPDHPGALAHTEGFTYWGAAYAALVPSFVAVSEDWAGLDPARCGTSPRNADLEICTSQTTGHPTRRIVVAGDSHAGQFLGALLPIAEKKNWEVTSILRGGCPFSTDSDAVPGDQSCIDWNTAVVDEIVTTRPDAVMTIGTRDVKVGVEERVPAGYIAQWRKVDEAGIPVLAVRDNPRFGQSPSACVESRGAEAPECATPRYDLYAAEPPYETLQDLPPNVRFVDFSDYFCTAEVCPPVIGNVLVYLDDNHVSGTYMSTMSAIADKAITEALGWADDHAEEPPPGG
ncbi:acyltransferase [Amycolatopsis sp. WAC 04169]|uniref:acyltransferase family protein n=1 Tax=Amycolatopsis sp. WAC 04169 TaxID=2203197 RepID=UPI000F79071E|nr:acyltransferase family protein [Amycolatopsis sp. WAC 04169]RSN25732.1 acyltransferase [Amycolatopsis sp. WAC 04169]